MWSEIDTLARNKTWHLTTLPPRKKALGCKWVYKIKRKSDDSIERYKVYLVILGNTQVEGLEYNETFAGGKDGHNSNFVIRCGRMEVGSA